MDSDMGDESSGYDSDDDSDIGGMTPDVEEDYY